ncbi:hypothetical protein BpHYR1_051923, partial [Brachionus plicatilis]
NIDKAKSSQIKAQNNNRPVTQTVISTGSKVWISVMGLNEKLHPKYRGPFTVLGQTKNVGRPRKTNANHVTFPNMLNILITILFFLIKPLSTVRINGRFTVCETRDQTNIEDTLILNSEKDCYASHATQKVVNCKFNTNGDQIFKINQTFNECGMKLYGSTEGIFLTYNRTNLPKIKADFVTIHDLILADSDGIELKTYTALDRLKEKILLNSVEVENYDGCTKDPKVSFELSGKRNTGYLSKSNIIRYDNEEQCKAKRYWVRKINNTIISIDKNGITWFKSNHLISVNNITSEVESLKFNHDVLINDLINLNIEQSTSKNQNLVNEDFDISYYYRGLPFGLSHFINWLKNSVRNFI